MDFPPRRAMAPCRNLDRLPRGGDRDIGAGYAMAMAAAGSAFVYWLLAAVSILFIVVALAANGSSSPASMVPFLVGGTVGLIQGAVISAAFFAVIAFGTGVVAWRLVPASRRYSGAIGGLLATLLAYLVLAVLLVGGAVVTGGAVAESVGGIVAVVGFGFVLTSWITLPLGVLSGTLYERSRSLDD